MKIAITYSPDEIELLDDELKEQLDDGVLEIEKTPEAIEEHFNIAGAEDVTGLRNALKEERTSRKEYERRAKSAEGRLAQGDLENSNGEKDAEIAQLKSTLKERETEITTIRQEAQEKDISAKITTAVARHKGDVDLLMPHLKATLAENPDLDLDDAMSGLKERHPGAFRATSQSGGGSQPGTTGGPGGVRQATRKRRSEMTEREKVDAQRDLGLDAYMELPE